MHVTSSSDDLTAYWLSLIHIQMCIRDSVVSTSELTTIGFVDLFTGIQFLLKTEAISISIRAFLSDLDEFVVPTGCNSAVKTGTVKVYTLLTFKLTYTN